MKTVTQEQLMVGKVVHFYPGMGFDVGGNKSLPNGMDFAPAMILQTFGNSELANMVVFVAIRPDQGWTNPHFNGWSVYHKDTDYVKSQTDKEGVFSGFGYWEWPPVQVDEPEEIKE